MICCSTHAMCSLRDEANSSAECHALRLLRVRPGCWLARSRMCASSGGLCSSWPDNTDAYSGYANSDIGVNASLTSPPARTPEGEDEHTGDGHTRDEHDPHQVVAVDPVREQ